MKKLSKLLAVVLAIAVVICPMVSVVANAEDPANGYKISRVDANTLALEITSTTGFLVYKADVTFEDAADFDDTYNDDDFVKGLKVDDYSLVSANKDEFNYPTVSSNYGDDVVTFIVNSTDAGTLDLYSMVKVLIHVATDNANATLTGIQAADEGTVETDPTLIPFAGVNPTTGEVDQTSEYAQQNATPVDAHTHDLTHFEAKASTCQTKGNSEYWACDGCSKYFSDEEGQNEIIEDSWILDLDATNHEGEPTGDYQKDADGHWQLYSCCSAPATSSNHVFDNACDTTCDTCGYIRTVGEHTFAYYAEGEKTEETHTVKCSECGATQPESHTGGTATCKEKGKCEVCGYEYIDKAEHTWSYTKNNDGTHNAVCTNACECGEVITNETCDTNGAKGACSKCGYRVIPVNSSIKVTSAAINYGAQLGIGLVFTKSQYASYNATTVADYDVVITRECYNDIYNITTAAPVVIAKSAFVDSGTKLQYITYDGIGMHELNLNVKVQMRCYDADGDLLCVSPEYSYVPVDLIKESYSGYYAKPTKAGSPEALRFLADTLALGGAAQRYFKLRAAEGTDLYKLTDYVDADDGDFVLSEYASPTLDTSALDTTSSLVKSDLYSSTYNKNSYAKTVDFALAPCIGYMIKISSTKAVIDSSKLTMDIEYDSLYPESENISVHVEGSDWIEYNGYWYYRFTDLRLYDENKSVCAKIYYDGKLLITDDYSVESHSAGAANDKDELGRLYTALAKFSLSSRQYFSVTRSAASV